MAVTHGYCSVQDIRDQLGDAGNKLAQALIERAINATSRAIDDYTGRRFWQDPAPVARRYRPRDPDLVWIDDVSTVAGLVVKTDTAGDGTFATTWASTDYQLEPLNADTDGRPWTQLAAVGTRSFPTTCGARRRPGLQVTAQFGWPAVPDGVFQAAVLKAVSLWKRKDAPWGVAGFGDLGIVRVTRRDTDVLELLQPFIRTTQPEV